MSNVGRPKKEIDWDLADKSAALMCTGEEIANLCCVSYDTLIRQIKEQGYADFAEWFGERSAPTLKSLRRKQIEAALGGNTTMMVWLGKQYLGQKEKSENENVNKDIQIIIGEDESEL